MSLGKSYVPAFYGSLVAGSVDNTGCEDSVDMCPMYAKKPKLSLMLGLPELKCRASWVAAATEFFWAMVLAFLQVGRFHNLRDFGNFILPTVNMIMLTKALVYTFAIWGAAASGGHLNPSITFATCLIGRTSFVRFLMYAFAQTFGMVMGYVFGRANAGWGENGKVFEESDGAGVWSGLDINLCNAGQHPQNDYAFVSIMPSFIIFFAIICTVSFSKTASNFGPLLGPLFIGVGYYFTATMGSVIYNPAECISQFIVVSDTIGSEWKPIVIPFLASIIYAVYHCFTTNHDLPLLKSVA